ncbi:MAG TPA: DoxX family protein [Pseudolabrys sp.]|nr:DoxX family protein [Pseudolabrys sp.]
MSMQSSSHPALSGADSFAASSSDLLLLVGRILLAWLFLASGYGKLMNIAGTTGYFNNLGMPVPGGWAWFCGFGELIIGVALILGIATRYVAILTFFWVLIATAIAHRYWNYPMPAQIAQYNNFLKNLAIMGGALYVLVYGAGGYSADAKMAKSG